MLAAGVRAREPITDARLVGPGLTALLPDGQVAAPVRLADLAVAALVRTGDRVDVLAIAPERRRGGGGGRAARSSSPRPVRTTEAGRRAAPARRRRGDGGAAGRRGHHGDPHRDPAAAMTRRAPLCPPPAMWVDGPMIKGFKDFLLRGNVVDLAVAVVIGTAFTALVTAFTDSFLHAADRPASAAAARTAASS